MAPVNLTHSVPATLPQTHFVNEPFVDFTQPENKRRMQDALSDVQSKLGRAYDIVMGGKRLKNAGKIFSMNPPRRAEVTGARHGAGVAPRAPGVQAHRAGVTTRCQTH